MIIVGEKINTSRKSIEEAVRKRDAEGEPGFLDYRQLGRTETTKSPSTLK